MRQERKVVTVLFCDLVGFTARAEQLDPEDVAAVLAPYHARVREELERYGGTVEKFIGDAVMALFGAPIAHEDDPERAVRAGLAIREFAQSERTEVRIGIATGEALVSLDARAELGETVATGDVINTGARLQTAAPVNGVLVSDATYRSTQRAIDYQPVDAINAKGKSAPVRAWLAVGGRGRFGVDVVQAGGAPLVGRERERAMLAATLSRARVERQPQLVTLVGVPGVGKSRLIYELSRIADDDPELIRWRQGRSLPYGRGIAFWALGEIVKAEAGILEGDGAFDARAKLAGAVRALVPQHDVEWVQRSLLPLLGLAGDTEQSEERHAMTYAAWRRFFEGLAEHGPAVVVFEDLQWADDDLLDFIDELVERVTGVPLVVVCSARPELLERRPGWGGGKRDALTISLAPLSDEDTRRLIAALLERPGLPADQEAALLQRAGGNPLFAEEFVRMVVDVNAVPRDVPETLQGIVAARIDALASAEKELLESASVLGKVFWTDALAALSGLDAPMIDDRLYALERKEFVRREHPSAVGEARQYVFMHVLLQEAAYRRLPRGARANAHLRVADWIDSLPPDRAGDRAEMLAHHLAAALEYGRASGLETSGIQPRAAKALCVAGDRAWALGAPAVALDFYERSRALDMDADDDAALMLALGRALVYVRAGGQRELERAALLLAESNPAASAEAEVLHGESIWQCGDQRAAFEHFDRATAIVSGLPRSHSKSLVLSQVSRFLVLAGRNSEGQAMAEDAIDMVREVGDNELLADLLTTRGTARGNTADPGAIDDLEHGLALALETKSWRAGRAYINLAETLLFIAGDLRRAEALTRDAVRFAEDLGIRLALRWGRGSLALLAYLVGLWDEALALCDVELDDPEPHYMQPTCRRTRALIRLAQGDELGARDDIESSMEQSRRIRDPQDLLPALAWRALILARTGDRDGAAAMLQELAQVERAPERWEAMGPWGVVRALAQLDLPGTPAATLTGPRTPWREVAGAITTNELVRAGDLLETIGAKALEADTRVQASRKLRLEGRSAEAEVQLRQAEVFYRGVRATAALRDCRTAALAS